MKQIKLFKTLFSAIIFGFVVMPGLALSAGLTVQFEQTPLFKEASFVPGGTVTRFVKVTNTSGEEQKAIIEAINKSDPSGFSQKLNLEIKHGATVVFSGTLNQFFAAGEVNLSQVSNGSTEQYDLKISFDSDANNSFQDAVVGFDLLVGFNGEGATDNPGGGDGGGGTVIYGGGGGGGSVVLPPGLIITGELSKQALNEVNEVEITWLTNYASTSAVIYDDKPNTFDFSKGEPSFGYAFYKTGDDSGLEKVVSHKVTLTGLVYGQTYYYRVVSHASPATIGREYSFVVDRSKITIGQESNNEPQPTATNGVTGGGSVNTEGGQSGSGAPVNGEGGNGSQNLTSEEGQKEISNNAFNMASLVSILPAWFIDNIWPILAIILAILGYMSWKKGKKEGGVKGSYFIKGAYCLWTISAVLFIIYFWRFL